MNLNYNPWKIKFIACAQRQMHTRIHHSVTQYEHTTRKKAVKHLINPYDYSAGKENKN